MTTTTLAYTPLAAGRGLTHPDAETYHQRWLLVDEAGNWLEDQAALSPIEVGIRFGYLVLTAPGMLRLDIPLEVIEDDDSVRMSAKVGDQQVDVVDEGEVAAIWASKCLGIACRLVKIHPEAAPVRWPR